MQKLLRIESSLFDQEGVSNQLADRLIDSLAGRYQITTRNVNQPAIPHLDAARIGALMTAPAERTPPQQAMVAYSDQLIAELQAADILVIGAPMYNFSVPSVLKSWFDHIARAGVTFRYTEHGPQGLLKNKTAYVITTRGGIHKHQPSDSQIPYLQNILAFIGINDVRVIYAEGLNMGDDARQQGIAQAEQSIQALAA